MEATSYTIIGTWFVGLTANSYYHWLDKRVPGYCSSLLANSLPGRRYFVLPVYSTSYRRK